MSNRFPTRRRLLAATALALLAGCQVVPKGRRPSAPPPPPPPVSSLPQDAERHRVALLVPLTGPNAAVGQSIANAATMALLDTDARNLRITNYDTGINAGAAANKAVTDGNELILGPLLAQDIPEVAAAARPVDVPVISFSNDVSAASRDVFIMGTVPAESVDRTLRYAAAHGVRNYAALVPRGEYGQRASAALLASARRAGGAVAAMEPYDRSNTSVASAARRLSDKGGFDAVMIVDGGRIASLAAPQLRRAAGGGPRLLGTELWSGDGAIAASPALRGAWFSALSDTRFRQFSASYKSRFGAQPYRLATMGYDAVLLTLRVARDWRPGAPFPLRQLVDPNGFLGLDGAFRFGPDGVVERALEVREVRAGTVAVVSPAPAKFGQ